VISDWNGHLNHSSEWGGGATPSGRVTEIEREEFLRIKMQGQNGLYDTKLKIFLSVL